VSATCDVWMAPSWQGYFHVADLVNLARWSALMIAALLCCVRNGSHGQIKAEFAALIPTKVWFKLLRSLNASAHARNIGSLEIEAPLRAALRSATLHGRYSSIEPSPDEFRNFYKLVCIYRVQELAVTL
jgi:hypothetical protein